MPNKILLRNTFNTSISLNLEHYLTHKDVVVLRMGSGGVTCQLFLFGPRNIHSFETFFSVDVKVNGLFLCWSRTLSDDQYIWYWTTAGLLLQASCGEQ